jgi:hypothetical protein
MRNLMALDAAGDIKPVHRRVVAAAFEDLTTAARY